MFILRKVSGNGVEMNFSLGENYTHITKESNPEEFKQMVKSGGVIDDPIIYGYIAYDGGKVLGLSSNQSNYIMTESGITFSNVSLK